MSLHSIIFNCINIISGHGNLTDTGLFISFFSIVKFYGSKKNEAIVSYNSKAPAEFK